MIERKRRASVAADVRQESAAELLSTLRSIAFGDRFDQHNLDWVHAGMPLPSHLPDHEAAALKAAVARVATLTLLDLGECFDQVDVCLRGKPTLAHVRRLARLRAEHDATWFAHRLRFGWVTASVSVKLAVSYLECGIVARRGTSLHRCNSPLCLRCAHRPYRKLNRGLAVDLVESRLIGFDALALTFTIQKRSRPVADTWDSVTRSLQVFGDEVLGSSTGSGLDLLFYHVEDAINVAGEHHVHAHGVAAGPNVRAQRMRDLWSQVTAPDTSRLRVVPLFRQKNEVASRKSMLIGAERYLRYCAKQIVEIKQPSLRSYWALLDVLRAIYKQPRFFIHRRGAYRAEGRAA